MDGASGPLNRTVLVVDDDRRLRELLAEYLTKRGFDVRTAEDGRRGLDALSRAPADLVILDLMMPDLDGLEVCRQIRTRSAIPIIMLTARGEDTDRIIGLEVGADDYLPKPFNPRELLARINAVLRRATHAYSSPDDPQQEASVTAGELRLEPSSRTTFVKDRPVELTSTEFDLLLVLARSAGRVVSRDGLMEQARGADYAAYDRSVDVHISHIRKKLEDDPRHPRILKTIRGVGYMVTRETS
ncbi:MAG: response regulator [Myxococcota bacterium]